MVSEPHGSGEKVVQQHTIRDFQGNRIASAEKAESRLHVNVTQVGTPVTTSNRPKLEHGSLIVKELLAYIGKLERIDQPGVRRVVGERAAAAQYGEGNGVAPQKRQLATKSKIKSGTAIVPRGAGRVDTQMDVGDVATAVMQKLGGRLAGKDCRLRLNELVMEKMNVRLNQADVKFADSDAKHVTTLENAMMAFEARLFGSLEDRLEPISKHKESAVM